MLSDPPLVFADLALARRLERAEADANARFIEARARAEPEVDAEWIDVGGTYAMFDGVDSPLTQSFGLGLFEALTAPALDRIEAFFTRRGAAIHHEVSPFADPGTFERLFERRYRPIEFTSVMYRPLGQSPVSSPSPPSDLQVRAAAPHEASLWADLTIRGWSHLPELGPFLRRIAALTPFREATSLHLAHRGHEPIAAAALCRWQDVALLAGACTVPEARRLGAQNALLEHRLAIAAAEGATVAMMCAAPGSPSQRNAERWGFRVAYTRTKWERRTAS